MLSFLKDRDFLGETINFSINKSSNFKSVIGGFFSCFIIFSYIFFFGLFGSDFLFKKNPNTFSEIRVPKNSLDYPTLNLNDENFLFGIRAFSINSSKSLNISSLFHPEINYVIMDDVIILKDASTSIDLIPCHFDDNTKIKSKPHDLTGFLCPNISQIEGKSLGNFEQTNLSYISLVFNICKPYSTQSKCDQSLLFQEFKNGGIYIEIISPEINYDTDNFKEPFKMGYRYDYHLLDFNLSKIDDLHLIEYTIEDDVGILFESVNQIKKYGFYSIDTKYVTRSTDLSNNIINKSNYHFTSYNEIYKLNLFYHTNYFFFSRKYMKFQDFIGNVKGFMEMLIFIIEFFYKFYNKFCLNSFLFNRLVLIKYEKFGKNKINKFEKSDQNSIDHMKGRIYNLEIFKNQNDKLTNLVEFDYYKDDNKETEYGLNVLDNSKKFNVSYRYKEFISQNLKKIENNRTDNKKKRKNFELSLNKFTEFINQIDFKFFEFCSFLLCKRKQKFHIYNKLEEFIEKINNKFDIFYYLKMIKKNKLLRTTILNSDQYMFLKILSKKSYNFESLISEEKEIKDEKIKDINEILWTYYNSENSFNNNENIDKKLKISI